MDFGNVDEFIPSPIPGFQPLRFTLETDERNFYETYISLTTLLVETMRNTYF